MSRTRVTIVGAGFGGLACAKALAGKPVDVVVVDQRNYHLFTPLLYQVASSLLNPGDIAQPVRAILRGARNVRFVQGVVTGVDFDRRSVALRDGKELPFHYLVLAVGSTTSYFSVPGAEEGALGLKDLGEALELRNHILASLEGAARADDAAERARLLTFVVVGGGPTGVEYAGALSELLKLVIPRDYPEIGDGSWRIILLEALPRLLNAFPDTLGEEAARELRRKGVTVRAGTRVQRVRRGAVDLDGGEPIDAGTLVWAAGVRPSGLVGSLAVPRSRTGRIEVGPDLGVMGLTGVYAIGDAASFDTGGKELAMLSAPAMQQGRHAGRSILREIRGEAPAPFRYRDKGIMATIGRNSAVAKVGRLRLKGFVGWLAWLFVHLYYLIGFRNRVAVLLGWAWNYVRFDRPVRIIARARSRDDTSPRDG